MAFSFEDDNVVCICLSDGFGKSIACGSLTLDCLQVVCTEHILSLQDEVGCSYALGIWKNKDLVSVSYRLSGGKCWEGRKKNVEDRKR